MIPMPRLTLALVTVLSLACTPVFAEDLKGLASTLLPKLSSYGCDELVEGSQSDNPVRWLLEW